MEHLEIERKYLIRMPERSLLSCISSSEIEQVYILSPEGVRERVRRRVYADRTVYTHTVKRRLNDLSREEIEEEISEESYQKYLAFADPERRTIRKKRLIYSYKGQDFEIDLFPFWNDRALMELELSSEDQTICLPPEIDVIREVTSDRRYTNSAIAREIPRETI